MYKIKIQKRISPKEESTVEVVQITQKDNVLVALTDIKKGKTVHFGEHSLLLQNDVARGHKIALKNLAVGDEVIKYGWPIGTVKTAVGQGETLDEKNIATNLKGTLSYTYDKISSHTAECVKDSDSSLTFMGYKRVDGSVATRNEVWIVPTVFCINHVASMLGKVGEQMVKDFENVDACAAFPHHFGCSQMGKDHLTTQRVLAGIINNPNAAAVLVVGLGCENNNIDEFKQVLGKYDEKRVMFLNCQDVVGDEVEAGKEILRELFSFANSFKREPCLLSSLRLGLKCGSSDGMSGITANPLIGTITDRVVTAGGCAVMTEVPEMFGAERILMNRAKDKDCFNEIVKLINDFKEYYLSHGEIVSDNPSPGNKKGGISTLEEKSLGCIQKGGTVEVSGVLDYAEPINKKGLLLLQSPGNDGISTTALAVSGCTLILYSTGRGTPFGTAVPAIKISSNTNLFEKKPNWIDFNSGVLVTGKQKQEVSDDLLKKIIKIASGDKTCDEIHGFKEINIWKDGVSL